MTFSAMLRSLISIGLLSAAWPVAAVELDPARLPPELRGWVDWVEQKSPQRDCPLLTDGSADANLIRACIWPGVLSLDVDADGARFAQSFTVYAAGAVPLPGASGQWPQGVSANNQRVPVVVGSDGAPSLMLDPGTWEISGRIDYAERPAAIALPAVTALVDLRIDGAPVSVVERGDGDVSLNPRVATVAEADRLELTVYRLLSDGIPLELRTLIEFNVGGQGRDLVLDPPLPAGFVPTALSGDLPARLDSDGKLTVRLRSGVYRVELAARATDALASVSRPAGAAPWPVQEVWSVSLDPALRVVEISGAAPIDAAQAGVPPQWSSLPAYLLEPGTELSLAERSRGRSPDDRNALSLRRDLWLDFDGDGWRFRDQLIGQMVRDWRLDLITPYRLERADIDAEPLLITVGAEPALSGVEVREANLRLSAVGSLASGHRMPAAGWQQPLNAIDIALNLPPGYVLYAAFGADQAPDAWLHRWSLVDVFAVAFLTMIAFWRGRWTLTLPVLGLLLLAYFELPLAALWLLLLTLALALAERAMPTAGAQRWFARLRLGALVLTALAMLPFAVTQLRDALYPQLENLSRTNTGAFYETVAMTDDGEPAMRMAAPPAPASESMLEALGSVADSESLKVTQRYAPDLRVQAGSGDADWRWRSYDLHISGPVLPAQNLDLWISPPWLTRLLRLASVALLLLALWQLAARRAAPSRPRAGFATSLLATSLLAIGLLLPPLALAQSTPAPEVLQELEARLLQAPPCAPSCAALATLDVDARGSRIALTLEVHAQARSAVPLPLAEPLTRLIELRLDGVPGRPLRREADGRTYVVVERGVSRIDAVLDVGQLTRVALPFALPPQRVGFGGDEWVAAGISDARLASGALELSRVAQTQADGAAPTQVQGFAPFVRVTRTLVFDLDWRVETVVQRLAPVSDAFTVRVPVLDGELVSDAGLKVRDGAVDVAFAPNDDRLSWSSRLERNAALTLNAPTLASRAEVWRVAASPMWHVQAQGVPALGTDDNAIAEYRPLPGERLELAITRPQPIDGGTLAFDQVGLHTRVGLRATEHQLSATVRSTSAGQHTLGLPADAEVLSVSRNGEAINLRPENGLLRLPIEPGVQQLEVRFRDNRALPWRARTPQIQLNAPAANLTLQLSLPADRWVMWTAGPRLGPAVLYWPLLLALFGAAYALSKVPGSPLKMHQWILLGIGFSTFSWLALAVVVAWLFALGARRRWQAPLASGWFNFTQVALVLLTGLALLVLALAVPQGLLGTPDMQISGYGSSAANLIWFDDQTASELPIGSAISLSLWWYKAAMLAWSLWLAASLLGWLRDGWIAWSQDGMWRRRVKTSKPAAPASATVASAAIATAAAPTSAASTAAASTAAASTSAPTASPAGNPADGGAPPPARD